MTVPQAMVRELAGGSLWRWDESWIPPTPADARRLRAEIEPSLFETVVARVAENKTELRSADVYRELHAEGVIASETPNAEQRGRVSAALRSLAFAKAEGTDANGNRFRVWRREAA
jgi:hypothetical protein